MGSCGFLWVVVGSCGRQNAPLEPIRTYQNPVRDTPAPQVSSCGRLNAPLEPIRTYQNPVRDNALPLKSAGRVRFCGFLWVLVSSCGFLWVLVGSVGSCGL